MDKKLLFSITKKDLKIDFFSGTGAGGQHRNKHQNCVRLRHSESGTIVTGQSYKERSANVGEALRNLLSHPKFKLWHTQKTHEILTGVSIEERVEEMMAPGNIKVEHQEDGRWVES